MHSLKKSFHQVTCNMSPSKQYTAKNLLQPSFSVKQSSTFSFVQPQCVSKHFKNTWSKTAIGKLCLQSADMLEYICVSSCGGPKALSPIRGSHSSWQKCLQKKSYACSVTSCTAKWQFVKIYIFTREKKNSWFSLWMVVPCSNHNMFNNDVEELIIPWLTSWWSWRVFKSHSPFSVTYLKKLTLNKTVIKQPHHS